MLRCVRNGLLVLAAAAASGCYSYFPIERASPRQEVRITVPARASVVQGRNSQPESFRLEGRVVAAGDTLLLETENRREVGAFREIQEIDTLRVATESLLLVEEKVFSRGKSIGLGVVVTAGSVALVTGFLNVVTGGGEGDVPGPPGGNQGQIRIDPIFGAFLRLLGR